MNLSRHQRAALKDHPAIVLQAELELRQREDSALRSMTPAASQGEGLVTEEVLERALDAFLQSNSGTAAYQSTHLRAALAAVAPDIAAAAVREALAPLVDGTGREGPADADDPAALLAREVRRQCAEQVRAVATSIEAGNVYDEPLPAAIAKELRVLAGSWGEEQG